MSLQACSGRERRGSSAKGTAAQLVLANIVAAGDGLPIKDGVQDGTRDAACALAGLDKVADKLK